MWDLGSRSVITLVSVLSGCVFLYNVWGPILILTISLFLTIYACYSLIVNDSLLSPHAFLLFDYCKHISLEVCASVQRIVKYIYEYIRQFRRIVSRRFRERNLTKFRMERRRGTRYQLSDDTYPTRSNSSSFGSIAQLSPISKDVQKTDISNNISPKNKYYHNSGHSSYEHSPLGNHTVMPMFPRNKEELENQTFGLLSPNQSLSKKLSPAYRQNHALAREDSTYYNSEGSMWDTGLSPKMDASINELRGAQAIGGPLLSSTRYNIDQRIYSDVNSPGLTTRLTKYAAEANNKLMHQSQYRVGQFPKVNLHASPVPLINAKSVRPKTPVTVRVAPPHTIRYSPPSKQKIFSNSHHPDNSYSSPSVTQSLRAIPLKRRATKEDVASDLAKKQRTESLINKEFEQAKEEYETKQKRSREEESLKSEEDASPQSKAESANRPTKRTKTPSCYDIINSLSSSKHVVSGVKRKAIDFSRSGTPDFEKHFKSLESIQNNSSPSLPQVENVSPKCPNQEVVPEKRNSNVFTPPDKMQEQFPLRGILKSANKSVETDPDNKEIYSKRLNAFDKNDRLKEPVVSTDTGKLTHKLFMRAEPERNEKLRMLVEEQGNIRAKFTTDDVEEIKKEDIADMRQTSMKARLQSMFDAISGKAASQINPDVVIQAEEVNPVKPVECPVTCATLNSSTTTTNVNTTPISTSAVAPSFGVNETSTKNTKHVAFNLPNKEVSSNIQSSNTFEAQTKSVPPSTANQTSNAPGNMFTTTSAIVSHSPATNVNVVSSSSTTPNFNFGTSTPSMATSTSSSTLFTPNAVSSSNNLPSLATSTTTSLFGNVTSNVSMSSPVPVISSTTNAKTEASLSFPTNVPQTVQNVSTSSNLSVGSGNVAAPSTSANIAPSLTTFVAQSTVPSTGSTSITSNMNAIPLRMSSSMNVSSSAPAPVIPSLATIRANMEMISKQSVPLLSFGNKSGSLPAPKPKGFFFGSVGNVSQSGNTFGSPANSQQVQSTNTNTGTSTTTSTSMNGPALQSSSASNVVISSTAPNLAKTMAATFTTPAISTFSFRAPNPWESNKTGFSFNNAPSATKAPTETSSTPAFSTGNNALPSFGSLPASNPASTAASNPPQFTMNANPIFGNASTSSIFGTTTPSQSIFGTPSTTNVTSTTFAAPKSSATPMFGSNVNTTSSAFANMNTAPVFSNTAAASSSGGTTCTLAVPVFGSSANTSAPSAPATTGSLFSGANSTSSAPAFGTTSNIFGQVTSSSATFKNTTGVFGSNSSTPNLFRSPTTTTSTFGTTNVASSSNNSVPVFGSANTSSNVPAPAFGTTSTVTPVFGSQNTANSATPGTTAPTFGTSTNIFGSSSSTGLPAYGSNTGSPFGSSASSTFGGQNPSTSNAFGATSNVNANANVNATSNVNVTNANTNASSVPAFGDNKALPFGAQSSTFGSSSAPNTAFGAATNANNENNNAGSIFSFGANQKQPQQNTAFSFGSGNNNANNNATTSSSAPFQFSGAPSNLAASTGGFNFSAATTTPSINFGTTSAPTFNATAPGMFSIGSGFTAPRSRTARSRKPR
ncbi:nuclear pore complex protein DDB_G0274915-like isoform X1 [Osmia bicornis bicornis]|uniref:nuclear pore complex protein DDB_G0274915-like isoform X1 n=1 Tax=Osmia bicornis bicornis TaxID=1437191 RepID=UPI0010F83325|nr:nuclear pore complex protein DDB_G0274915-like isoform X1 [Osmia bicornis bicornis]